MAFKFNPAITGRQINLVRQEVIKTQQALESIDERLKKAGIPTRIEG